MTSIRYIAAFFGIIFLAMACNGENVPDCFQNAGDTIREELVISEFDKLIAFENTRVVLIQGNTHRVEIETGAFLRDEVSASVREDGTLILRNENNCNLFRDFGLTTFYVTAPNLLEVRSSTGLDIVSQGVLSYPELRLISESFNNQKQKPPMGFLDLPLPQSDCGL